MIRPMVFAATPPPQRASRREIRLARSAGSSSQRAASLSRKSRMREGASRKSSACAVGGVSSTISSASERSRSCPSRSSAMYSCDPARTVESVW